MMSLLTFCNDCGRRHIAINRSQNGMVTWRSLKSSFPPAAEERQLQAAQGHRAACHRRNASYRRRMSHVSHRRRSEEGAIESKRSETARVGTDSQYVIDMQIPRSDLGSNVVILAFVGKSLSKVKDVKPATGGAGPSGRLPAEERQLQVASEPCQPQEANA